MLTSRFPGEVSGADLPTLTNPAGAGDIAAGKQAIRQDGGVVTGSLPSLADMQMELDDIAQEGTDLCLSGAAAQDGILRSGDIVTIKKPLAHLGNAEAMDVAAGKTFTSSAGIAIDGTLPSIAGSITYLNCGQTHTIPAGRHSGTGKVQANSLYSQTNGTAAAKDIASGKTAWVNGVKVTGTGMIAEIITRSAVVTITPDEVIVGEVDKVITYTCPDGYIPFSISTSNPNAIVEITSVELISPVQGRWKLTYHMTWAGDTMEEVASTISLIKV